ncbi:hypothetical protein ACFWP7_40320 [Streptomyces sp. NPDC058470]|uniref:hypothetical protein n=1 Tax=Streptomyces sp. NPDC058470 TaxID=3346515 RepID=UPI00365E7ABD
MKPELTLWKDRDPAAMRLPGIYCGILFPPLQVVQHEGVGEVVLGEAGQLGVPQGAGEHVAAAPGG